MGKLKLLAPYKQLNNSTRYTFVTGGRGSAKSFHGALFELNNTYTEGQVSLYTRFTMSSAQKSIIPEFKQKIQLLGRSKDFYITRDEIINKHTESKIMFSGIKTSSGNQTGRLKSIQGLTRFTLEEGEELRNEKTFEDIDNSVRQLGYKNSVCVIMNPCDKQHFFYKNWFQSGQREDTTYIHTTYLDNLKNLDESFIRKAERLKETDLEKYQREFLGEWGSGADLVFPKGFNIYDAEPDEHTVDWVCHGGDFGFINDPTTIVQVKRVGRNLFLKEKLWMTGLTNPMIAEHIKGLKLDKELIIFDSAEPKSIKDLKIANCNIIGARKGPDSVMYGITKVKEFTLHIHKDSKNLQEEFDSYSWMKNQTTGEFLTNAKGKRVPKDLFNHGIDPTRYVVSKYHHSS
jgi:phage terminase large subunit